MLTTASIAQTLQGTSATNGWDAVLALNLQQANALSFQDYLEHGGPAANYMHVQAVVDTGSSPYHIIDLWLGKPELRFQPGGPFATLEMEVIKGSLISCDVRIENVRYLRPKESRLTGSLALARVKGDVNQVGKVVLDLGASAYTPTISGVDRRDTKLNTAIGLAIRAFFANNATTILLGTIAPSDAPPALQPTTFQFTTQQHPNGQDACVLVLIQTNGTPGTVAPLAAYPIPDGHTAALLIDQRTLFAGAFVETLNKMFASIQGVFEGSKDAAGWSTTGKSGAISLGQIGQVDNHASEAWSSGSVEFPLNGFTIKQSGGLLQAGWASTSAQDWFTTIVTHYPGNWHSGSPGYDSYSRSPASHLTLGITYQWQGTPTIATENTVTFVTKPNSETCEMNADSHTSDYYFWQQYSIVITKTVTDSILTALKTNLGQALTLVDVKTFALVSLQFPGQNAVSMKEVALPGGLLLTGSLKQPIAVTPADSVLAPGGKIQFNADSASGVLWEIKPSIGSISATGLYTAPAAVSSAQVVVVTAVDKANAGSVGRAMVLVYQSPAAQGIALTPARSLVTPGQRLYLSAADAAGKPIDVAAWTLSPNLGQITLWDEGKYWYDAPASITDATDITVTASGTSAAKQVLTGTAVIQLTPSVDVEVRPTQPDPKLGGTMTLTASVSAGDTDDLVWLVYPTAAGKVVADSGNPAKATYTAPSAMPQGGSKVWVVAYLVDDQTAGVGGRTITLKS
jgi:hypothetical protein